MKVIFFDVASKLPVGNASQVPRLDDLLGAAIDLYPEEPHSNEDPFDSQLRGLDNLILPPHIGGSTVEAQENIGIEVAEKMVKYSDNGTSTSSGNFPEAALPALPGKHRLLHVHRNVPGTLRSRVLF